MVMSDPTASVNARVGTWIKGKYHLDRLLGVGGMAAVYAATHRNKKRFAVKMLHPELSHQAEIRARFLREGYVANTVDHPGAVAVLDDDVAEDGSAFLVMELLEGETVEAISARTPSLPLRAVLDLARQLLEVLAAAHEKGIVHRDIKPANLLLTRTGQLKVLDFGIARLRDGQEGLARTRTGLALGTPAFMAPEQALGKSGQVDAQTDVWAVGATMFTLLTNRFVHQAETAQEQMVFAATRTAPSLAAASPETPAQVVDLVARALAFDKAARWPSAAAMRDAVDEASAALFPERVAPDSLLRGLVSSHVGFSSPPPATPPPTVDTPIASGHTAMGAGMESVRRTPARGLMVAIGLLVLAGAAGAATLWIRHSRAASTAEGVPPPMPASGGSLASADPAASASASASPSSSPTGEPEPSAQDSALAVVSAAPSSKLPHASHTASATRPPPPEPTGSLEPVMPSACNDARGGDCPSNGFCQFGVGNRCGRNRAGVCKQRPRVCTDPPTAICGCDGRTYASRCEAWKVGVSVASVGSCL